MASVRPQRDLVPRRSAQATGRIPVSAAKWREHTNPENTDHVPTYLDSPEPPCRRSLLDLCDCPVHTSPVPVVPDPQWLVVAHAAPDNISHTWRTLCCWCDRLSIVAAG